MLFPDRSFRVYSGTVLENIKDCTYTVGEDTYYRKRGRRFLHPEGVFFTTRIEQAARYALFRASDLESDGWSYTEELLSDYYKRPRIDRYTPVIMSGQVSLTRKLFNFLLPTAKFPVDSLFVLEDELHAHEALYYRRKVDWTSLFHQVDLREFTKHPTSIQ